MRSYIVRLVVEEVEISDDGSINTTDTIKEVESDPMTKGEALKLFTECDTNYAMG